MKLCLKLAKKGSGKASPNPMVGAVVVKEGKIVGEGFHPEFGRSHAEIFSLEKASENAQGASLYVNLEPCPHYGKTPPCTEAIIKRGIREVIVGMSDPNPIVIGKGIDRLREEGISVKVGILEKECKRLNEAYIKYITQNIPFVIMKVACSLDGKIATRTGDSKYITSEASRRLVHRLRNEVDGVVIGIGTLLTDDPLLTVRLFTRGKRKNPLRIVVDTYLQIPLSSRLLNSLSDGPVLIATTESAPKERIRPLKERGAEVIFLRASRKGVDLKHLLEELGRRRLTSIILEGGSEMNASFLEEGLVDKILLFLSPTIIGGKTAKGPVGGEGVERIKEAIAIKEMTSQRIGKDILIEGYL